MKHILCALKEPSEHITGQILPFARARGWQLELCGPQIPPGWFGDGIISDFFALGELATVRHFKTTPTVSRILPPKGNVRTVFPDTFAIAHMAADYLIAKGFRNFVSFSEGSIRPRYIHGVPRHILTAFGLKLQERGYTLVHCHTGDSAYGARVKKLQDFLQAAPKPVAMLLSTAAALTFVYRAIFAAGLRVPEEVAVLCNTDNQLVTENAIVPTSYIAGEFQELGNQLCQLLDDLLNGRAVPEQPVYGMSSCIVTRRSTDTLAVTDLDLAKAITFLLQEYASPIRVEEAARIAGVSNVALSRLFAKHLQISPGRFLFEIRLNKARELLAGTDFPLAEIARRTGYGSDMALSLAFKRETGLTPGRYRRMWNVRDKASKTSE